MVLSVWKTTTTLFHLSIHRKLPFVPSHSVHSRAPAIGRSMSATTSSRVSPLDGQRRYASQFHLEHIQDEVDSTQEEAKRLLSNYSLQKYDLLAVIADRQRHGRGTNGRVWVAQPGNLFLTCVLPKDSIPISQMTLLPLGVGSIIASVLSPYSTIRPTVKWPNDVLLQGQKIAGVIIETYQLPPKDASAGSTPTDYWLVGIGINVDSTPDHLPSETKDFHARPRMATCLRQHAKDLQTLPSAVDIGTKVSTALQQWAMDLESTPRATIIQDWVSWADWTSVYQIRETGETVQPLGLDDYGRLHVRDVATGTERHLAVEYLY